MKKIILLAIISLMIVQAAAAVHLEPVANCPNVVKSVGGPNGDIYWWKNLRPTRGTYAQQAAGGSIWMMIVADPCVEAAELATHNEVSYNLGVIPLEVANLFIPVNTDPYVWTARTITEEIPGNRKLADFRGAPGSTYYIPEPSPPYPDSLAYYGWFKITLNAQSNGGSVPEFSIVGILLALLVVTVGLGILINRKK